MCLCTLISWDVPRWVCDLLMQFVMWNTRVFSSSVLVSVLDLCHGADLQFSVWIQFFMVNLPFFVSTFSTENPSPPPKIFPTLPTEKSKSAPKNGKSIMKNSVSTRKTANPHYDTELRLHSLWALSNSYSVKDAKKWVEFPFLAMPADVIAIALYWCERNLKLKLAHSTIT